jgi:hypothetical protein
MATLINGLIFIALFSAFAPYFLIGGLVVAAFFALSVISR